MTRPTTIADVIAATCDISGLTREDIIGHNRSYEIVAWRHAAMYLAFEMTGASNRAIGLRMGGRDHTTILWGRFSAERRAGRVPGYAERLALIRELAPGAASRPRTVEEQPVSEPPTTVMPPVYNDGRRLTTKSGHVDRFGNLICNP